MMAPTPARFDTRLMTCSYCGVHNEEEEHRCRRCGRRLDSANPRPAPGAYPVLGSVALPAIQPEVPVIVPPPEPGQPRRPTAYQAPLFAAREVPKIAPLGGGVAGPAVSAVRRQAGLPGRPPIRRSTSAAQQSLDLRPYTSPGARTLRSSAEASIYCNARAASPMHRALATALDLSMILIAVGIFLAVFHFSGGDLIFSRITIPIYSAVPVVIALLYELLWTLPGGVTPGMKWTQLRLLNFDGRKPAVRQRLWRVLGTFLSLLAGGMGLIWALFDEENLTWHDHISKTFPTPATHQNF
jgi:uncharacterized RDD family membrane protein YckC